MNLEMLIVAKVFRKKEPQEIISRSTGKVECVYYPVILDDGDNTIDTTVPKEVYEFIEEDEMYVFRSRFNDNYAREGTKSKPKIESIFFKLKEDWRKDFLGNFQNKVIEAFEMPFNSENDLPFADNSETSNNSASSKSKSNKTNW